MQLRSVLSAPEDSFGIYVHIPFCVRKCPYCDFNSYPLKSWCEKNFSCLSQAGEGFYELEDVYVRALLKELESYAARPEWSGRVCHSIFFGGGTPSIFSAQAINKIIHSCRDAFVLTAQAEISLEANPGSIDEELGLDYFKSLRAAQVNRLSIGVQSFSVRKLRTLGRIHSPADNFRSIEQAKKAGFDNFSIDLIFGVLGERVEEWSGDLLTAIEMQPTHLSTYALTLEGSTPFAQAHQCGEVLSADEETQAALYTTSQ